MSATLTLPTTPAPALPQRVESPSLVISGAWLKIARVQDELWLPPPAIEDPEAVIGGLRASRFCADLFTFTQAVPDTERRYRYAFDWENWAVAPTSNFDAWWEALPQESRKNTRKAEKRGITVGPVAFDDTLVHGIKALYDETPVRQGRRFWHYGKDLATVARENGTYLDRSDFIGAYLEGQLIGFIKMVRVGDAARIMQILARTDHQEKHPMNALLTAAVKVCAAKGIPHLIYGQYVYGQKQTSSVTEFKRRNGFKPLLTPRYYVPLTAKGRIALATRLHRPVSELIPERMLNLLLNARRAAYGRLRRKENGPRAK
jgi:hypothetical protein